jgi:hypothetical protein
MFFSYGFHVELDVSEAELLGGGEIFLDFQVAKDAVG